MLFGGSWKKVDCTWKSDGLSVIIIIVTQCGEPSGAGSDRKQILAFSVQQ